MSFNIRRTRALADVLATLCLAVVVGHTLLEPLSRGTLIIGHDMDEHFHREAFNRQAFALGEIPLWNPYVFSGIPAQADIQTGVFYPPYWILRLLPLELGAFFMWSLAAHLWLLGLGTYALCRQVGITQMAALAAAVGMMLGGVTSPRIFAGHLLIIYGFCWMPLVLALTFRSMQSGRIMPQAGLVIALVTQFLAGASQPSAYTLALVALTSGTETLWPSSPPASRIRRLIPLGQLGALAALSASLSAFQALPMLRFMLETGRGAGLDYEQATKGSLYLSQLWTILFPNAFADFSTQFQDGLPGGLWEKSAYVGCILPLAAPLAVWARPRRYVLFFIAVAIGALAFAFGENLPIYQLHYALLPGFRVPSRLLSVFALAVSVLGAFGLDALTHRADLRRLARIAQVLYAVTIAAGALALIAVQPSVQAAFDVGSRRLLTGQDVRLIALYGFGLLAVLIVARITGRPSVGVLLAVGLITVDVRTFASQFLTISGPSRNIEAEQMLAPIEVGRVLSICQSSITANAMMSLKVPTVDGHNSAFLRRYADYAAVVQGGAVGEQYTSFPNLGAGALPRRMNLMDALNVTHIHSCRPLDDRYPLVQATSSWQIYGNPSALQRAYWVCQVERVSNEQRAARALRENGFDPSRQAVVVAGDPGVDDLHSPTESCTLGGEVHVLTRDTPAGELAMNVDSPGGGLLVVAETYYPEREAWVDGQKAPLVRANLALNALALTPGPHLVELRYVPSSLYLGTAISVLGAVLWACASAIARRRQAGSGVRIATTARAARGPLQPSSV
jgi:hypothetical protein